MIQKISFNNFVDSFKEMGRKDQFSYDGKRALYNYLTDLEEDTGHKIELDIIALCCDYCEYKSLKDFQKDHGEYKDLDSIREQTQVIEFKEGFITQNF